VGSWTSTFSYLGLHPPIWTNFRERSGSSSRNISENMHDHSFSSIISELSSNYHHIQLKSCIGPNLGAELSTCPSIPPFQMDSNIFSLTLHNKLGFPHLMVCDLSWCICSQPIDLLRIHIFRCAHGVKRTTTHDVVWDSFTSIVKDVEFHVLHEQTHVFSMSSLQSYCVYIIWYLPFIDIVIVDSTHVNLVSQAIFSQRVIMIIIV